MYYAVHDVGSSVCSDERYEVHVFRKWLTKADWVEKDLGHRYSITRQEAARIMRQIMEAAYGGRQSGYEALRHIIPE